MNRAIPAVGMTAVGLGLVLSFKTTDPAAELQTAVGPSSGDGAVAAPDTTAIVATEETISPTTDATTTTAATTTASGESLTVTGPVAMTRWGPVQVEVVVENGTITDITALQLPGGESRSERINARAEPILREEALQAQSAEIDVVSGATVTWQGYTASLQAALDAAGL